jgi:N-acyl homoserine lactone hydrolase
MNYEVVNLFEGYPIRSSRGFLGWSSVYLIKVFLESEQEKYILFDTGGYNERGELIKKLNNVKLTPQDIDIVFLSHIHFDHAMNWPLFENAEILVSKKELTYANSHNDLAIPEFHRGILLKQKNVRFVEEGNKIFDFEIIELPGHTPGLIGLKIDKMYFVSDAIKNRNEVKDMNFMNVWNKAVTKKTIEKIISDAEVILPGHDTELTLKNGSWEASNQLDAKLYLIGNIKDKNGHSEINITI